MNPTRFVVSIVNFFITLVTGFLALRFILKLFGANGNNDFVGWVYDNTSTLLDPFRGIFSNAVVDRHYVIEFNTLFAIVVYMIIGFVILAAINALTPDTTVVKKKRK